MAGPKSAVRPAPRPPATLAAAQSSLAHKEERPILFQHYFKSGLRTYAAQVKQGSNGKPFLVLTEGRRDPDTDELHKSRVLVFSDDLTPFFHMLQETATFLRPLRGSKTLAQGTAPVNSPDPFAAADTPLPTRTATAASKPRTVDSQRESGRMQPQNVRGSAPQAAPKAPVAVKPAARPSSARVGMATRASVAAQPAKPAKRYGR